MKKNIIVIVIAIALALLLTLVAGCGGSDAPQTPATPGATSGNAAVAQSGALMHANEQGIDTLIVGTIADLESPSRLVYNFDVYTGTLSQLAPVYIDENAEVHPLATLFATTDFRTWTLTVIDGLTWHDGVSVTADDIKFTIESNALHDTGAPQTTYSEINVRDARTLDLVLPAPNVRHMSGLTTLRLYPKHEFANLADRADATVEQMTLGNGPFKFAGFDTEAGTFTFEAYDDFVWGRPNVDTVIFRQFGSPDMMNLALKAGEIDMVYAYAGGITASAAADLETSPNIRLIPIKDTSNPAVLVFNNNTSPGNDANIRRAVAHAINYDAVHNLFGSPYSVRTTAGFVPSGSLGFIDTPELSRDLQKAREYLAAAGATNTEGNGVAMYNGAPLTIELMVRSDIPVYERYAELLKLNLADVGIDLVFRITDVPTFREVTENTHAHQLMITRFTAFGMNMQAGMGTAYITGRGASLGQAQVFDPEFDAILDRLRTAATLDAYISAAAETQTYYAENLPALALLWDSYIQAVSSGLDGFFVDGTFGLLNAFTWFSIHEI